MEMQTDADMTALRLAKLGITPSREHMAALSDSTCQEYVQKTAQETDAPFHLSFIMGRKHGDTLRVWIVQTNKCWELIIHSDTFCHVDDATLPLDVKLETALSWLEMREDW